MEKLDLKILKAIKSLSPTSFVGSAEVNKALGLDRTDLGDRLMLLKKSGHVETITSEYVSSATLPNFIYKIKLTDLGRRALEKKK